MPNILIVDDEQSYRQLLSLVFEADGNNIRTAMNGRQALEALDAEPADVIISDVKMPDMASITKPFVATAVMQLVEKGRMSLDAPVTTYLPYFEIADPRAKTITVRQMLTHTSGMPDEGDYGWDRPQYDDGALERYVRSLKDQKLVFAPGERMQYSNMRTQIDQIIPVFDDLGAARTAVLATG